MIKNVLILAIVSIFIFSCVGVYAENAASKPTAQPMEKTKDRLDRGMHNLLCGSVEVPENMNQSQSKGTTMDRCSQKTRTGVERGIARLFSGVWQLATFWYSDPDLANASSSSSTK